MLSIPASITYNFLKEKFTLFSYYYFVKIFIKIKRVCFLHTLCYIIKAFLLLNRNACPVRDPLRRFFSVMHHQALLHRKARLFAFR